MVSSELSLVGMRCPTLDKGDCGSWKIMDQESEYLKRPDAMGHLKVLEVLRRWDPLGEFYYG
jgi:hypothetical protein